MIWLEASQFGILNAPGGLADLDRVLQRADGFDVLRIVRVDENAHRDDDVSDANPVLAQRMDAGAVDDLGRVLVFVDHLHRQEALAGVRKRDGDRTGVEIEHRRRIERIAVHPDDGLPGERRRLPPMHELAETSVLDDSAEKEVRFRPGEIVGGDALLGETFQRAGQMLLLHRIGQAHAAQDFRREIGDAGERDLARFRQRVADA